MDRFGAHRDDTLISKVVTDAIVRSRIQSRTTYDRFQRSRDDHDAAVPLTLNGAFTRLSVDRNTKMASGDVAAGMTQNQTSSCVAGSR